MINTAWQLLRQIKYLKTTTSYEYGGLTGTLNGQVNVKAVAEDCLIFVEKGIWQGQQGKKLQMTNTYRWQRCKDHIELFHLRFGPTKPLFLVDFAVTGNKLTARAPHLCGEDTYSATLIIQENHLLLHWQIKGPTKQGRIANLYSVVSA